MLPFLSTNTDVYLTTSCTCNISVKNFQMRLKDFEEVWKRAVPDGLTTSLFHLEVTKTKITLVAK